MENLWAPWRMDYVQSLKDADGCIFCTRPAAEDDEEYLIVQRGKLAYAMLNLYPYNNGHLLIAPYNHEAQLDRLDPATQQEMLSLSTRCMQVIRETMQATGFNFGANIGTAAGAGNVDHFHLHVVPRWVGDTNFMPVLGHTKVQVQGLRDTRDLLARALAEPKR